MSNVIDELQLNLSQEYHTFFKEIKNKIRGARFRAALAVNAEVIKLYWYIGKQVIVKQEQEKWGSKFLERLSVDLRNEFPETRGFSVRNLYRMRQFSLYYSEFTIVPQAVAQLPWAHISILMEKVKFEEQREWYANQAVSQGWSRALLVKSIDTSLYQRQAISTEKVSNYPERLPSSQSVLAEELLKQPYNFDFLGLHDQAYEREIEYSATEHISKFLLELGKGFAFVGRQVPVELEGSEYFIDMLFYHLKLHTYVVVEFKATKFKPEHTGQLNFYLNLVDDFIKTSEDNPSIGLLLCKSRKKIEAEYALKGIEKPIGISEYELTKLVPETLQSDLPSIEEIENELNILKS